MDIVVQPDVQILIHGPMTPDLPIGCSKSQFAGEPGPAAVRCFGLSIFGIFHSQQNRTVLRGLGVTMTDDFESLKIGELAHLLLAGFLLLKGLPQIFLFPIGALLPAGMNDQFQSSNGSIVMIKV